MDLGFAYKIMRTRAPVGHPPALSTEPSAPALASTATAGSTSPTNPRSQSPSPPKQLLNAQNSSPLTASTPQQPQSPDEKSRPLRSLSAAPVLGLQRGTADGTRPPSPAKRASPESTPAIPPPEPSLPSKLHMVPRLMLPSARGVTIGPFAEAIVATIAGKPIRRRADPLSRPVAPPSGPASSRNSPKRTQPHRRNSSPSSHAATARVVRIAVQPGYAPPPSAPTMMTSSTTNNNNNTTSIMGASAGPLTTDNDPVIKRAVSLAGPLQLPRVTSHQKLHKQHTAASLTPGRAERDEGAAAAAVPSGDGGGSSADGGGGGGGGGDLRPPSLVTVASAPLLTESGSVTDSAAAVSNRLDSHAAVAASSAPSSGSRGRRSGAGGKEPTPRADGAVEAARSSVNGGGSGGGGARGHLPAAAAEGVLPGIVVPSWRPPSSEDSRSGEGRGLGHGEGRHHGHGQGAISRRATMGAPMEAANAGRGGEPLPRHAPHPRLDDVAGSAQHHLELPYSPRGGGHSHPHGSSLHVTQSASAAEGLRSGAAVAAGGQGATDGAGGGDGGGGCGNGDSPRDALPLLPSLPSSSSNLNSVQPGRWALAAGPITPRSSAAAVAREPPVEHRPTQQPYPSHVNLHALARASSYTNLQRQQSHSPPHPHPQAQLGPHQALRMAHAPSSGPSFLNITSVAAAVGVAEAEEGDEGALDFSSGGGGVTFGGDLDFGMDAELEALEQWAAGGQAPPSVLEAAVEQRRALRRLSQLRHKLLVARSMCSSPEPGNFFGSGAGSGNGGGGLSGVAGGGGGSAPPALPSWAATQSGFCGCEQQSLLALASQVSSLPHIDYEAMRDPQYRMKLKLRAARQPKGLHPAVIAEMEDMPIRSRHRPWKPLHI